MFHGGVACCWQHLNHANPHKTASPRYICHWCKEKPSSVQQLISAAFKPPLDIHTDRANNITEASGIYISTSVPIRAVHRNSVPSWHRPKCLGSSGYRNMSCFSVPRFDTQRIITRSSNMCLRAYGLIMPPEIG